MRAEDWDQQLLDEHRAYVISPDALAAFDTLVEHAERLLRYDCGLAWHGRDRMRIFRYADRFAPVVDIDASSLLPPTTAEDRNWHLPGAEGVRTDRNVQPGKLPHVVFSTIAVGGATMASLQAVMDATVAANSLAEERHTALRLLEWAARDRGVSFTCIDGVVTASGYRLEPARPFEFIVTRDHLRFYVRPAGRHRIAGGLVALSTAFPHVEHLDDHWVIDIATRDDALRLQELVFAGADVTPSRQFGRPYVPVGLVAPSAQREPFTVDPAIVDRGNQGHASTQDALATFLRAIGVEPRGPDTPREPDFDVGWMHGEITYVAEVKSITSANEEHQLRLGLGQVLRYRHMLAAEGRAVNAVLVPEREPSDRSWIDLCRAVGVTLAWPTQFEELDRVLTSREVSQDEVKS